MSDSYDLWLAERPLHWLVDRVDRWCRRHLASRAPDRLIDPDGEGIYLRLGDHKWDLRNVAFELGVTGDRGQPLYRDLVYEVVWMRQRGEEWFPLPKYRARESFKFPRWAAAGYAYLTPPAEPAALHWNHEPEEGNA